MNSLLEILKNSLPKYTVVQPSNDKVVTHRPFTVREEKSLMMAKETGSYTDFLLTVSEILDSCYGLNSKKLPVFDVEYFFLKLREKSVSEFVKVSFTCPYTQERIKDIEINLSKLQVKKQPIEFSIKLTDDIIVNMEYPKFEYLIEQSTVNPSGSIDLFDMVLNSINSIQTPAELIMKDMLSKETLKEFIENLTKVQYEKILDFFVKMPKVEYEIKYITSDDVVRSIVFRGIRDFFQ